jgi:hypothetical protein
MFGSSAWICGAPCAVPEPELLRHDYNFLSTGAAAHRHQICISIQRALPRQETDVSLSSADTTLIGGLSHDEVSGVCDFVVCFPSVDASAGNRHVYFVRQLPTTCRYQRCTRQRRRCTQLRLSL